MSDTIQRASSPTPDYRVELLGRQYEEFSIYYGQPLINAPEQQFASINIYESAIRYVESDNAHMLVRPHGLPERPMQILIWGALGRSIDDTARELHIGNSTAKTHRSNMFARLGATSIAHAVHIAFREQVLQPTEIYDKKLKLTAREKDTLTALSQGLTKEQVAPDLRMTHATVRTHVSNLLANNQLQNVVHAVTRAFLSGDIPVPEKNPSRLSRRVFNSVG